MNRSTGVGGREDSAQAANDEHQTKARRSHRRGKPDGTAPDCSSQLKVLMAEGTAMNMVETEKCAQGEIHAADKHVVTADDETEEGNGDNGVDHGLTRRWASLKKPR